MSSTTLAVQIRKMGPEDRAALLDLGLITFAGLAELIGGKLAGYQHLNGAFSRTWEALMAMRAQRQGVGPSFQTVGFPELQIQPKQVEGVMIKRLIETKPAEPKPGRRKTRRGRRPVLLLKRPALQLPAGPTMTIEQIDEEIERARADARTALAALVEHDREKQREAGRIAVERHTARPVEQQLEEVFELAKREGKLRPELSRAIKPLLQALPAKRERQPASKPGRKSKFEFTKEVINEMGLRYRAEVERRRRENEPKPVPLAWWRDNGKEFFSGDSMDEANCLRRACKR